MGKGFKIVSVFLRIGELVSAAIVAGFVGEVCVHSSSGPFPRSLGLFGTFSANSC
jgi:hypothetical protein